MSSPKGLISRIQAVEYKWLVAAVFVSGLFMDLLDTTIVNVALPTIGDAFNADTTTLEWVVTGYLLSLAVWIPASGWLGDRFGTKRVFMFALAMFTFGSTLCGLANSIETLILFRVIQGIGGGMLTPVGTAMLFRAFPPNERAAASAVLVIPIAIAPAVGPILGGILVDTLSWRWIFFVNIPIGVLGFLFAARFLRESREPDPGRFDYWGFVLSATGLPLVLYALAEAPGAGWTSSKVLITGIAGIVLLALLVVVETRVAEPMLALRLFKDRMFRSASIVNFAASAGLIGLLFLLPLFLQNPQLRGLSATQSGLTTFPQAIGLLLMSRLTSRLYPKIGPRRMLAVGSLGSAIATIFFLRVGVDTNLWWIRAIMFARGMSFAFALIPLQAATFSNISRADSGRASSLFNTNRQVASSFGVAILATVLADRTSSHVSAALAQLGANADAAARNLAIQQATVDAFHDAFLAATIFGLIAFAASFLIHDEDAAASMAPVAEQVAHSEQAEGEPVVVH
jgi:EmrB/QacA subfamily drug resistance transporter